jgi:glycosyltransferase involved in cell wall biosynthesis
LRDIISNLIWTFRLPKYDVIHVTGDIHYAILGLFRRRKILTIHDLRFVDESKGFRRWILWLGWIVLPVWRADIVTVISEFTKTRLLSLCRVDPSKVKVVPNCVGKEFFPVTKSWPTENVRALLVGTTSNKNLERVMDACFDLPLRFAILGFLGTCQKALMNDRNLDYEEYGGLSRDEVVNLYQACDLVIFVSTYEGFGMPILEAQAVGRPVITSDLSPMGDVAGEGALKVDPFDVDSIRSGVMSLMNDKHLREQLVHAGFQNVAGYSSESVAELYAEIYRDVMN